MKIRNMKKKHKNTKALTPIRTLEASMEKDCKQLEKLYKKAIAQGLKSIKASEKALANAKREITKNKKQKTTKAKTALLNALQNELTKLIEEQTAIESGYSKFLAEQKTLALFEKEWKKAGTKSKTKAKSMQPKKSTKKTKRKPRASKVPVSETEAMTSKTVDAPVLAK